MWDDVLTGFNIALLCFLVTVVCMCALAMVFLSIAVTDTIRKLFASNSINDAKKERYIRK